MSYELTWEIPDLVLCLNLGRDVSMDEFIKLNEHVHAILDERQSEKQIIVKIDVSDTKQIPRDLSRMSHSQTYANRHDVKWILVIGSSKYVRLIMMLTFNLSQAILQFADDHDQAKSILRNVKAS